MAFVLHQTWAADEPVWGISDHALLAPLLAGGRDRHIRRAGGTLFSILVHILLIWMLLNKLAGGLEGAGEGRGAGSGTMMLLDLSDPAPAAAPQADARTIQQRSVTAPAVSEVDTTASTELPPPEWTVSRLPPAPAPQRPQGNAGTALAAASTGAGGAGAGAGGGQGGTEVYDPFAGAAPLLRDREARAAAPSLGERVLGFFGFGQPSAGGLTLDEAALEAIRRTVARSLPGRSGTAEIVVRVSPTGVVLEADSRGGSAPAEARAALGRALVGKRLFKGSAVDAQLLALPALSLS